MTEQAQTHGFQAEVKQLLHLVVHSLYSNKEIFLRELISNASDACEKLRFEALTDSQLLDSDTELHVRLTADKDAGTLTISDNGIGMNRDDVVENLGVIARSGTRKFMEQLTGEKSQDSQMIGQFGVGFYSSFIVAERVTVITRRAGLAADEGVRWESTGEDSYQLESVHKTQRGTDIILHLRDDEKEFLEPWRLRSLVSKYSDHISLPVIMAVSREEPVEEDESVLPEASEQASDTDTPKTRTVIEDETLNQASAFWTRSKSDISDEEYQTFYKHVAHDFEDALAWTHNRVEGRLEYTSLLYIPKRAPFDLWERKMQHGIKLYVQRVFIMEDAEKLLPRYLRFVRGVIDSNDLPLNVSRELLQDNKVIERIRNASVKKILGQLEDLAKNDQDRYQTFWQQFGLVLKEGLAEDPSNKEQIARLIRFASTHDDVTDKQTVSLDDYLSRMPEQQDKIYYITADGFAAAKNSPHLEIFRAKNIEVLLLGDRVDEWLVAHLHEYQGKSLQSVAKGALDLDKLDDEAKDEQQQKRQEEQSEAFADTLKRIKGVLSDQVNEVRLSKRLKDSPACLVVDDHAMSAHLERILKEAGQQVPGSKPHLELNADHFLVRRLRDVEEESRFADWAKLLHEQAILSEGAQLEDPAAFVKRMNDLLVSLTVAG